MDSKNLTAGGKSTFRMAEPGEFTVKAGGGFSIQPTVAFVPKKRPETPEDALALMRAFYDAGDLHFYGHRPEVTAKLDANPMLKRTEPR